MHSKSVVSSVLYSASNAGINVITIDDADYDELSLSDNELLKVLSNIVNNAVEALKNTENPTIKFKSYNTYDGIIINIINNGPKIPDQVMGKLFNRDLVQRLIIKVNEALVYV